jgi:hypothetical protein
MCENCEYATRLDVGYKILYGCNLIDEESEIIDTYFNEREELIECPKYKISQAMKEVELMRSGKLPKKTWDDLKKELNS